MKSAVSIINFDHMKRHKGAAQEATKEFAGKVNSGHHLTYESF